MKWCLPVFLFCMAIIAQNSSAVHQESGYIESPFGHVYYVKMWRHKEAEHAAPIVLCLDRTLQGPEDLSDIVMNHPVILCTLLEAKKRAGEDIYFAEKIFTCLREQLDLKNFYLLGCFNELPVLGCCDPEQKNLISCVMGAEIPFDVVGWIFGVKEVLESMKMGERKKGRLLNFHVDQERSEIMSSFFSGTFPLSSFVFVENQ